MCNGVLMGCGMLILARRVIYKTLKLKRANKIPQGPLLWVQQRGISTHGDMVPQVCQPAPGWCVSLISVLIWLTSVLFVFNLVKTSVLPVSLFL